MHMYFVGGCGGCRLPSKPRSARSERPGELSSTAAAMLKAVMMMLVVSDAWVGFSDRVRSNQKSYDALRACRRTRRYRHETSKQEAATFRRLGACCMTLKQFHVSPRHFWRCVGGILGLHRSPSWTSVVCKTHHRSFRLWKHKG